MLAQEGYYLTWKMVDIAESLRRTLRRSEWDIIVSQCRMRGFSAYNTLESLTEVALDIPIIVLFQAADEMGVEALVKAGAVDFMRLS